MALRALARSSLHHVPDDPLEFVEAEQETHVDANGDTRQRCV